MFLERLHSDHLHQGQYKNENFNEHDHSDWRKKEMRSGVLQNWESAAYNHTL